MTSFAYSFFDGLPSHSPSWQSWVPPYGHEPAQYREGGLVRPLVAE
ncbi:MAG TPA: hypothetical protein VJQ43_01840 [Thermoplasmata archaeon]|nr:hypothetical protein [Thermoplasmata archaeon]